MSRLRDFRITARIARRREKGGSAEALEPLRKTSRSLGRWTWRFFWWQVASFGLGATLLVLAVLFHVFP